MKFKTETVSFVTCEAHGVVEGIHPNYGYKNADGRHVNGHYAYCPECYALRPFARTADRTALPARQITRPSNHAVRTDSCNGRCLNGKHSCSCHCGGKCHGNGACSC